MEAYATRKEVLFKSAIKAYMSQIYLQQGQIDKLRYD